MTFTLSLDTSWHPFHLYHGPCDFGNHETMLIAGPLMLKLVIKRRPNRGEAREA